MGHGIRPTGVTVLAILAIFMVIGCLMFVAIFLFASGMSDNPEFMEALRNAGVNPGIIDNLSLLMVVYALLYAAFTAIYALLAYSFLVGAQWGWWLGVFFSFFLIVFGIVMFIISSDAAGLTGLVFSLIIDVIILYFINTPPVIAWFKGPGGKGLFGSVGQPKSQY